MNGEYRHTPVMLDEALRRLNPRPGGIIFDCTLGAGHYARALSAAVGPAGRIVAIDYDIRAVERFRREQEKGGYENVILAHGNFSDLKDVYKKAFPGGVEGTVAGMVFDLGISSAQLEDPDRGLSFQLDVPLDMRLDRGREENGAGRQSLTAREIVNHWPEDKIARLLSDFGEEPRARAIAKAIASGRRRRPIDTTGELVRIIGLALPAAARRGRRHFATRTFLALRIAVNRELDNLSAALPRSIALLKPGGRIVAVSYHSLEDRIVKNFFRQEARDCVCPPSLPVCVCGHKAALKILTPRPVTPAAAEIEKNPRARSAKLRAAEKV